MNESLSSLIDAASGEAARLHRQGVGRSQAIRAAARAVRRHIALRGRGFAAGVGQEAEIPPRDSRVYEPDLPAAILVGAGAMAAATGRLPLAATLTGIGMFYHLAKG